MTKFLTLTMNSVGCMGGRDASVDGQKEKSIGGCRTGGGEGVDGGGLTPVTEGPEGCEESTAAWETGEGHKDEGAPSA